MPGLFDIAPFEPAQDLRDIRPQLEALRLAVLALRPGQSADIFPNVTAKGTTYALRRKPGSAVAAADEDCPFDITITETAGPIYTATFYPGTINQLLPTNYLTGVVVPASGTRYLVLDCTASNGEITSAAFAADSTPPDAFVPYAGQPPVAFKILIGLSVNAVAFKTWGCGNIQVIGAESFRLQKPTPAAGELPYDVYYTWELSVA